MSSYKKISRCSSLESFGTAFLDRSVIDKYAETRKRIIEKSKSCPCKKKIKEALSISVSRHQEKTTKVAESSLCENVLDKLKNVTLIRRNAVAETSIEERLGFLELLEFTVLENLVVLR